MLEGAYELCDELPAFHSIRPPTDEEIRALVKQIATRVIRFLQKQGHFADDTPSIGSEEARDDDLLSELQAASVQSKIALGDRRGKPVRRLGSLGRVFDENPETKAPLCAAIQGFSLHAGVSCAPKEREKLEKVARYIARPAIAEERLRFASSGNIIYKLKRDYTDGTSHLLFTPLELLEKMAALVPEPRVHLTRFHGCLAPNAKIRSLVVPQRPKGPDPEKQAPAAKRPRSKRYPWAQLLARIFGIDMRCPNCHVDLKPIAAIVEGQAIAKILGHLGLPSKPPDIAPARISSAIEFCEA